MKGWVKVYSYTQPRERVVQYQPWLLERDGTSQAYRVDAGGAHGKGVVAHFVGTDDRDAAAALVGAEIRVRREQFATTAANEFYWADLVGLDVETTAGVALGSVDTLIETGANDVLVLDGERRRLLPFVMEKVVKKVDLAANKIVVDWDPEF